VILIGVPRIENTLENVPHGKGNKENPEPSERQWDQGFGDVYMFAVKRRIKLERNRASAENGLANRTYESRWSLVLLRIRILCHIK
jgi:hypothetical protein